MIDLALAAALWALTGLALLVIAGRSRAARWPVGVVVLALGAAAAAWTATSWLGDPSRGPYSSLILLLAALPVYFLVRPMRWPAAVFFSTTVAATVAFAATLIFVTFTTHAPVLGLGLSFLLLVLEIGALALSIVFAYEIADVLGRESTEARLPAAAATYRPRVCVQVPAYNEPPELVRQTLEALSRLDYPDFVVQVVVNNTTDPALWRPVEDDCRRLGSRFQFIHLPSWPGYKAGALNEATRRLAPGVEVVAIVDADYIVRPDFLIACVPHLANPRVAFVQTPQHYRDWDDSAYLRGLFYAYRYFFDVTMVARARANAIIFGGTMGLIRVAALQQIGGWAEWCITEDAEASLRLLARGWESVYVNRPFGEGLMPLDFDGLRRQRYRWAFGGVQILRRHLGMLVTPGSSRLTLAQRYHYVTGALGWFADPLGAGLAFFLLFTSPFLALGHPLLLRQLLGVLLVLPVFLVVAGVVRLGWSMHAACGAPWRDVPLAAMVMLALSWTVTRAAISALVTRQGVFLRTPKLRAPSRLGRAVMATLPESAVAVACGAMSVPVALHGPRGVGLACATLLAWQAVAWGSAPLASLMAEGVRLTPSRLTFSQSPQATGARPRAVIDRPRRLVVAVVLVVAAILLTPAVVTSPATESSLQQALAGALPPVLNSPAGASPSPSPNRTPGNTPVVSPSPRPTPLTSPTPSPSPSPSPTQLASPSPTASPLPSPAATPSHPAPSPTPRPTSPPSPPA